MHAPTEVTAAGLSTAIGAAAVSRDDHLSLPDLRVRRESDVARLCKHAHGLQAPLRDAANRRVARSRSASEVYFQRLVTLASSTVLAAGLGSAAPEGGPRPEGLPGHHFRGPICDEAVTIMN